ncbi:MAG: Beta-galactosidase [Candidatus Ordinivivax streblomastigis]|uniref:Beta-galactosidase n=1 Tax=Candidatus Ordinivivax streblomastigis TaxID=2540710 RepID=A0A5M8P3U8_9BACT|nr:MAG: Beta-galactosidase [Candidatus Ordinivivax streblomastigis]
MLCFALFAGQSNAQSPVQVYTGTSLPTQQGWQELRFDSSIPWEQAAKDLLASPSEVTAVAASVLNLKVDEATDGSGFPLYSQLGWYKARTGFSAAIGYTVEFKAKVVNSPDGAFTVSGVGAGKGFRLEFSDNKLTEHANVLDTVRVLSTAIATDDFHIYRVAVAPDDKVRVWRDNILLGELPLQPFKLDNILNDGGFENGDTPENHGWSWMDAGKTGEITVSSDPAHAHSGKSGLLVNKGYFKNEFIPVKPGAIYDVTAWSKTIEYPEGGWRDLVGWHDPAADRSVYFVGDANNKNWKSFERKGMEGGAHFQRFIMETPTSDANLNVTAFDEIHYSERITPSRIPANAVNLFPNGDFENPCAPYFPNGDPRNDTCMVNPDNYRYSADAYYNGQADEDGWFNNTIYNAEHNAAPFWHPFWGARVRVQYNRQTGNDEAGNHWARGKYSLRFFNCFGSNTPYGTDFVAGQNEDRGSNSNIKTVPIELGATKTYTFLFSYHFAKWGGDHLILVVKNGATELFRKTINNDGFQDWKNEVITFQTDATNHALQILTERDGSTPGVLYLDDLFLFEGQPLPEDGTHLFFGKQTSTKGAEVEIEWIKTDNTGAYAPDNTSVSSNYAKKTAPLMTVWGEALKATDPILNEYPRPQLKREGWTNLNGIWDYTRKTKEGFGAYSANETYRQQILVPYPAESALSGIMDVEYDNQNKTYAYKRNVTIAKPTDSKRVILHFGAVDWESYVFVNGQEVAHHKGGFDPFSADVTDKLNASGTQEIVVQVYDPTQGGQPSGKQYSNPNGSWYSPSSGIWQTVWTEVVNPTYVTEVTLTPVDNAAVKVKVAAANSEGATATVKVLDGANQVATAEVAAGTETTITIANPKLWSPETPFLYNVTVELKKSGSTTDQVTSYFGLRKVEVKTLRNKPYIYLNGAPTFSYATLDHGYFPDGLYTPASYDALRFDLLKLKGLGFNAVRKFEKIEPAIWYHLADSLGLLVWQDIPAAHTASPATPIAELNTEAARKANFLRETAAMTQSIRNFPSIVAWIGFNDSWGQYDASITHTKNTVELLRLLNDGRLIVPESGGDHFELGDVVSAHGTPPVLHSNPYNERASINGVTGVYAYAIDGHVWSTGSSSDIKNDSIYAARLIDYSKAAENLTLAGVSGLVMVQTTDVENEINGLMTYDRKVYKAGLKADSVLKANIAFMQAKIIDPVLKTSAQGGEVWKYIAGDRGLEAAAGWNTNSNFDDNAWLEGRSAFGGGMSVSFPWNTSWKGDNRGLYLRKKVNIPVLAAGDELKFQMFYDEDYEFYINGVLAHSNTGWSTNYVSFDIYQEAKNAIIYGGDNLFAIHVVQNGGGSCMDLGVTANSKYHALSWEEPASNPVWKDIATAEDWMNIPNDLDGFYRLTADIYLFDKEYSPIGSEDTPFRGYIDGQNHTVTCPEISGTDRVGLFGYADGAHFVNLRFTEAAVSGGQDVGVLLGRGKGITVEHVVFDDDKKFPNEVKGRDHSGMVAGYLEGGKLSTIKDVYVVNGEVKSTEWQAGGLVGIMCDTRIINSYFTGIVAIDRGEGRLTLNNADASGIVARTEGGKNYLNGVVSLASEILSASGNEFISFNGGGYIVIDSATCFTRNDMILDPIFDPNRSGQYARAAESMKRPLADFKKYSLYTQAGWDMTHTWGIPLGGGFPIFRTIPGAVFETASVPVVKKENDLKVYSANGNVVMTTSQPTAVWIYNLQGSLVERTDINGTQTIALPRGIYIVKSAQNGNVKAVKILNQ